MQVRSLRSALLPTTLLLTAAPLLAGGETALSATEAAEVQALFEELLTFESSCTDACAEGAYAKKKKKSEASAKAAAAKGAKSWGYGAEEKACGGCGEVNPTSAMVVRLSKNPATWSVLEPLIEERFTATTTSEDVRDRILDVLAWEPSDTSAQVAGSLWKAKPAAFTEGRLVTFAQRGAEACIDGVAKLAKKGAVVPAAYLAYRGDETGKKTLAKAARVKTISPDTISEALLAGSALERLGDTKTLARLQKRVHAEVLGLLDAGEVEAAGQLALRAQLATKVHEAGKTASLGTFDEMIEGWCREKADYVADAAHVFELIEKVTPMTM